MVVVCFPVPEVVLHEAIISWILPNGWSHVSAFMVLDVGVSTCFDCFQSMINKQLTTARLFAHLMDDQFSFFGIHFGLDNILGVVPGLGDLLSMCLSFYLIWIGWKMELPGHKMAQMIKNLLFDMFMGSIPILGDIGDIFFKANMKNLQILEHFAEYGRTSAIEAEVIQE